MVVSPRAGVDSLIADTLVIDMDETDPLHHHYTIDRYIGSGNTGRTFVPIRQQRKGASNLPDQRRRGVVEKEGVRSSSYGTGFALLA